MLVRRLTLPLAALVLAASTAPAQSADPAKATGVRKELIAQLSDAEQKLVALAEAIPAEKYGWRPAPGVRSGERGVRAHGGRELSDSRHGRGHAGARRGPVARHGDDRHRQGAGGRHVEEVVRLRQAGRGGLSDAQMEKAVDLFGTPSTGRGVLLLTATHAHEHLGQAIAYARMNGIVPPWSRAPGGN